MADILTIAITHHPCILVMYAVMIEQPSMRTIHQIFFITSALNTLKGDWSRTLTKMNVCLFRCTVSQLSTDDVCIIDVPFVIAYC